MKTAILLSGGIDSCCVAFWKKPELAIHISYGQRSELAELRASKAIASELGIHIEHISIDCSSLGSGDLSKRKRLPIAPVSEWWPFRNQFLFAPPLVVLKFF